jgi:hypothetical protein
MNRERLETLLWERIDGTIAAGDLADLQAHITEHPEAGSLQRQIEGLAGQLDGLPPVAPPAELRARITTALNDVAASPQPARGIGSTPRPTLARQRPVSWLPIAAGLLVGVTVGYLLHPGEGGSVDGSRAAGTMTVPATDQPSYTTTIDFGGTVGSLEINRTGTETEISVDLADDHDLGVDLEAADGHLLATSVDTAASDDFEIAGTGGHAVFRTRGPSALTLHMAASSMTTPLHLVVSLDGAVVADQWIGEAKNESRK